MSDETIITLPDAETMLTRLKAVDDDSYLVEKFYSLLTKSAGQERVPSGVIVMLQLAVHDFTNGMPPAMVFALNMNMDHYIGALVADEGAATEAKNFWAAVQEKAKAG